MLQLDHISKSYASQDLFSDVTWRISPGDRVGLVGPNGAGKTTLCRILAGTEQADHGAISHPAGYSIGYLPQEIGLQPDVLLLDEVLQGRADLLALEDQIQRLEGFLAVERDPALQEQLGHQYSEAQALFTTHNGYALRSRAKGILHGMGFRASDLDRPLGQFSGGWQMRAYLSRLLLQQPDLLLMDEPTNHLDLPSLEWLEGFLRSYPGSVVIISHDRYFLNRMVTLIADLDHKTITLYTGNYDTYQEQKAEKYELLLKAAALQQKQIAHLEDFVERFRAKATKARQAQSRLKALEKIDRIEVPTQRTRSVSFSFPQPARSGQEVVRLANLKKSYGDLTIYDGVNLRIERGERVALVGPNGAGKSTLLKILADETPFQGERLMGYNVSTAFFAQHQVESLDLSSTVLHVMEETATADNIARVRGLLGAFLFSGDAVKKQVRVLSGGEKSRLALARMLLNPANFLLLDEPTNHLDIASCDVLEDALQAFGGTLCFVSHDRHFINAIATRVIHVEHGRLDDYLGDYEYYQWKRAQQAEQLAAQAPAPQDDDSNLQGAAARKERKRREAELRKEKAVAMGSLKKDLARLEDEIARHEQEKKTLETQLADPDFYAQRVKAQEALRRCATLDRELTSRYTRWEDLSLKIEEIEAAFANA